ncbi:hypothetical protein F4802DRAFT_613323 [Xylaria palmicola]|nr:hypothetical protein F4802DRAFT_613323 [Xylaria palmicola]
MEDHLSLPSPSPSDMRHLDHSLSIAFELSHQAVLAGPQVNMSFAQETHTTGKAPMYRWYGEGNDAPWHPPDLASGAEVVMRNGQFLVSGRPNVVPSEIIPQSDSGYGSYHNTTSIANGSVCGDSFDANADSRSIMGSGSMIDAQYPMADVMPKTPIALGGSCDSWTNQIRIETMKCEICDKPVRTKSELKKHDQRHKKPFKCDVKGCPRGIEGFSTTNDLDRHKRSVHPETQTLGNRYVCQIGVCKNKTKIWPRADNFKAHLKRVHNKQTVSDTELEACIIKQPTSVDEFQDSPRQEVMSEYNGYSSLNDGQRNNWQPLLEIPCSMGSLGNQGDVHSEENIALSSPRESADLRDQNTTSQDNVYQDMLKRDQTSHSPVAQKLEDFVPNSAPVQEQMAEVARHAADPQVASMDASRFSLLDESNEPLPMNVQAQSPPNHSMKTDDTASDSTEPEDFSAQITEPLGLDLGNLDPKNMTQIRKFVDVLDSHGLLEQFGLYRKESSEPVEHTKAECDTIVSQNHCHRCPTCKKTFPRRCELKKHEKRHEKPYGCTNPGCDKKFGSKNDWKRHENTQHFMLESWRCDDGSCEKVCYRRENFKSHLEKEHQIGDVKILEDKLEKCRVGRNYETRFWCGFCQEIVEIKQTGVQAWAERFDHIDEHFSGRNRDQKKISEWKSFGPSRRNKAPPREDSDDGNYSSGNAEGQHSSRQGPGHSRPKRKRDDDSNSPSASKRTRLVESRGLVCCGCGDLVTVSQLRCNFPCEHIPCDNCTRG